MVMSLLPSSHVDEWPLRRMNSDPGCLKIKVKNYSIKKKSSYHDNKVFHLFANAEQLVKATRDIKSIQVSVSSR